jgi:hypothetical protein
MYIHISFHIQLFNQQHFLTTYTMNPEHAFEIVEKVRSIIEQHDLDPKRVLPSKSSQKYTKKQHASSLK